MRLLRPAEVRQKVALSTTEINRRREAGIFPHPVALGARAIAWLESDINRWIAALVGGADDEALAALVEELAEGRGGAK